MEYLPIDGGSNGFEWRQKKEQAIWQRYGMKWNHFVRSPEIYQHVYKKQGITSFSRLPSGSSSFRSSILSIIVNYCLSYSFSYLIAVIIIYIWIFMLIVKMAEEFNGKILKLTSNEWPFFFFIKLLLRSFIEYLIGFTGFSLQIYR